MTKPLFTSGPYSTESAFHTPDRHSVVVAGKQLVALVYGETKEAQAANARLLAAAPDLLEVLRQAATWLRNGDYNTRGGLIEMDRLAGVCETALAKAEGRSNG